jgi:glyceraldehyde 3-phosphate dehydrogenase
MVLFRNQLLDRNVSDIINHEYAAEFVGKPISVFDSVKIAKAILELNLLPAKLDIGKLTYEYGLEEDKYPDAKYFVIDKLKNAKDSKKFNRKMLYCFGRIGLLARELMSKTGKGPIALTCHCNS